jgi:hypothetical protein
MASVKKQKTRKVNKSQPSEILKQRQIAKLKALLAEQKRQEEMRKEFLQMDNNNNNLNWTWNSKKWGTRRRR